MFSPHRHDDLKEMLDSNKDSLKLEAMKRIVAVSEDKVFFGILLISKVQLCAVREQSAIQQHASFKIYFESQYPKPFEAVRQK